jgi:hypothetical protein
MRIIYLLRHLVDECRKIIHKNRLFTIRRRISPEQQHLALLFTVEPSSFEEANKDEHWIKDMDEELDQIEKNDTCELVPTPKDNKVIGTKWVFWNELNESG